VTLSLVSLLLHDPDVSPRVRDALHDAERAAPEDRAYYLELAARTLACEAHLDHADAYELVGIAHLVGVAHCAVCGRMLQRFSVDTRPTDTRETLHTGSASTRGAARTGFVEDLVEDLEHGTLPVRLDDIDRARNADTILRDHPLVRRSLRH
jgi:hypothetical protein